MTCPTMLLGVEAPAVRPTLTGHRGNQSLVTSSRPAVVEGAPDRPVPHAARTRHSGSAM